MMDNVICNHKKNCGVLLSGFGPQQNMIRCNSCQEKWPVCWPGSYGKQRIAKMPIARANSIDINYETFGQPADPGLVLIMGLG